MEEIIVFLCSKYCLGMGFVLRMTFFFFDPKIPQNAISVSYYFFTVLYNSLRHPSARASSEEMHILAGSPVPS